VKDFITQQLFKFVENVVKVVGDIHMPWTSNLLKDHEIRKAMKLAKAGDVIIVLAGGHFTSFLLGSFSHAAFYLGNEEVLDATGRGVSRDDILSVMIGYNRIAILRPRFTTIQRQKAMHRALAIEREDKVNPIGYNYSLVKGNKVNKVKVPRAATCSQLVRDIINHGKEDFMGLRKRFGFMSVSPVDFLSAKQKFDLVYDTGK